MTLGLVVAVLAATSASAVNIFFGPPSATQLNLGETFTIELFMDTEGDTQINAVGVSVFADPSLFTFVEGTSPGQILFNAATFEGVARIIQPGLGAADPPGIVRAASFAALAPSGVASSEQLLATLTFEAVGAGAATIESLFAQGDNIGSDGVGLGDAVTFEESARITVVPEPTTALLMGLGLTALATAGRRRS